MCSRISKSFYIKGDIFSYMEIKGSYIGVSNFNFSLMKILNVQELAKKSFKRLILHGLKISYESKGLFIKKKLKNKNRQLIVYFPEQWQKNQILAMSTIKKGNQNNK